MQAKILVDVIPRGLERVFRTGINDQMSILVSKLCFTNESVGSKDIKHAS